ncbi:MAG: transketolase C-terminal domain-containing protein, partial [Sideroxyarcus sp.]|nr:transketolase C-terminal domain-containing protein [Sideroxyarcus sp.]
RFIEAYVAEQNMAGIASGLASRGMLPVAATFAAFWTRAYDQLRMAQYAGTHQVFIGTHAGVSIGHDGASQMGLEDIALFRTLEQSTVLYPSDAYAAEKLMHLALKAPGIVYIRATRAATPVLHARSTQFVLGGSHTLRSSTKDVATIVAAGITLYEAIAAADALATQGINIRVIDLYSIKPLDITALQKATRQTAKLIVVEDHRQEGGIAEAVRAALDHDAGSVLSLAVHGIPHSGTTAELLHAHAIDAAAIMRSVKKLLKH